MVTDGRLLDCRQDTSRTLPGLQMGIRRTVEEKTCDRSSVARLLPLDTWVQTLFIRGECQAGGIQVAPSEHHLTISGHTLNRLRRLRGLLLDESLAAA
jgi:hypothetical protein